MNWWIISSIIVFLFSIICAGYTAFEIRSGKLDPKSNGFWGSIAVHAITAIIAIVLLVIGLK